MLNSHHQKFNIIDAMIGAVEVDRDRVLFLGLYGRDMVRKANTEFRVFHVL